VAIRLVDTLQLLRARIWSAISVLLCVCGTVGASGFVIEPEVAERHRLPAFGDLSIAGIAGKVRRH
jgi:hypothetical protein